MSFFQETFLTFLKSVLLVAYRMSSNIASCFFPSYCGYDIVFLIM